MVNISKRPISISAVIRIFDAAGNELNSNNIPDGQNPMPTLEIDNADACAESVFRELALRHAVEDAQQCGFVEFMQCLGCAFTE